MVKREIICKRPSCGKVIGAAFDETYFEAGNLRLYSGFRGTCRCDKPIHWRPSDRYLGDDISQLEITTRQEILMRLADEKKGLRK